MEIFIGLGVVALIAFYLISQYNKLIRLNVGVDEAFAQIEVQLKRRADQSFLTVFLTVNR